MLYSVSVVVGVSDTTRFLCFVFESCFVESLMIRDIFVINSDDSDVFRGVAMFLLRDACIINEHVGDYYYFILLLIFRVVLVITVLWLLLVLYRSAYYCR